jgi:LysR family transcriptional regulator for metE and metH
MHLEFRHLRTIRAIHEAGGLARAADMAEHHPVRAEPSGQGARGSGRGRAFRAPVEAAAALGGGACGCCGWPRMCCRSSRRWRRSSRGSGRASPGGCTSPSSAMPASNGCFPCWRRSARHGPTWMWISARASPSRRCRRCNARRSTWWSLGPRGSAGRRFHGALRLRAGLRLPRPRIRWRKRIGSRRRISADQHLITYPVERSRLDVFSQLLIPAKVEPRSIRQVELTAVILLLVASGRGVSVLPDWVVREVRTTRIT